MNPLRRALTPEQKRLVMERVLAAWCEAPQLRLGQLIQVALCPNDKPRSAAEVLARLHYIEDTDLAELLEGWRK